MAQTHRSGDGFCARCGCPRPPDAAPDCECPRCKALQGLAAFLASSPGAGETLPSPDPTEPRAPAGEILGKYLLLESIGEGAMGVVYRAWDAGLQRLVALKVIRSHSAVDAGGLDPEPSRRFVREAQLLAGLHHPNIVPVYEIGEEQGRRFLAMEYVVGGSLQRWLQDPHAPSLGLTARVQLLVDVARGVHFAHEHGIIHRDLKPGNILLRNDGDGSAAGTPLVADFGLARRMGDLGRMTATGCVVGTPMYMSPEQCEGNPELDGRSDLFALGTILYELATGQSPFDGETPMQLLAQVTAANPPAPRRLNPRMPGDLETIILKAMEREPGRRYPTVGAFADDLGRFLRGEAIRALPVSWPLRLWRSGRGYRLAAAGLLLAAASAVGGGVLLVRQAEERRRLEEERQTTQEILTKTGRAQDVLARWFSLGPLLEDLGSSASDRGKSREELRVAGAAALREIDAFVAETPNDPASRATAMALAGWGRRLGGYPEEGLASMREAARLDPALPYGVLMEALHWLSLYLDHLELPETFTSTAGLSFGPLPAESAAMREWRARVDALLAQAGACPVWGAGMAHDFRRMLEAMQALRADRYPEAERGLGGALASGILQVFRGEILLARGKVRYLLQRLDESVEDMRKAAQKRPDDFDVHFHLGLAHIGAGAARLLSGGSPLDDCRAAIQAYDTALRLDPGNAKVLRSRAIAWTRLGDAEHRCGADPHPSYERAIADGGSAIAREPGDAGHLDTRGCAWFALGRTEFLRGADPRVPFARALADFDESLRRSGASLSALSNRARLLTTLGDYEGGLGQDPRARYSPAMEDWAKAAALVPHDPDVQANRALTRASLGVAEARQGVDPAASFEQALDLVADALRSMPRFAFGLQVRAVCRVRQGEAFAVRGQDPEAAYADAVSAYTESLALDPRQAEAWAGCGEVRSRLALLRSARGGDPAPLLTAALRDLDEALRQAPRNVLAYATRSVVRLSLGEEARARGMDPRAELDAAEADCTTALELDPRRPSEWSNRGVARLRRGLRDAARGADPRERWEGALADLTEALRLSPTADGALVTRGETAWLLAEWSCLQGVEARSEWERAVTDFAAASRTQPNNAVVRQGLQVCRTGAGGRPWTAAELSLRAFWAVQRSLYSMAGHAYEELLLLAGDEDPAPESRATLAAAHYDLACIHALRSSGRVSPQAEAEPVAPDEAVLRRDRAFAHLRRALELGWSDTEHLTHDPDLTPLRQDPRWSSLPLPK